MTNYIALPPDNYVQYPGSPSGYNRYQYANGNPLKYTDPSGDLSIGAWNSFWTFVENGGGMNGGYISGSMGSVIEFGSSDQAFGYGITQMGDLDWWGAYSGYATSYRQALNRYNGGHTTPNIVTGYYRYEWRNKGRDNINANYSGGVHMDQGYSVSWSGGYGTADPTVGSMFVSYNKMESLLLGKANDFLNPIGIGAAGLEIQLGRALNKFNRLDQINPSNEEWMLRNNPYLKNRSVNIEIPGVSRHIAVPRNVVKGVSNGLQALGAITAVVSAVNDVNRYSNGEISGTHLTVNLVMNGVGFLGPIGAGIGIIYGVTEDWWWVD